MPSPRTILGPGLLAAALVLSACGSSSGEASSTTAATTAAADSSTTASSGTAGTSSTAKVDANTASNEELIAAFTAAGVANPDRWAREVQEYRPYSGTDDWAMLKQELSKYNIDDATLAAIISTLEVNG